MRIGQRTWFIPRTFPWLPLRLLPNDLLCCPRTPSFFFSQQSWWQRQEFRNFCRKLANAYIFQVYLVSSASLRREHRQDCVSSMAHGSTCHTPGLCTTACQKVCPAFKLGGIAQNQHADKFLNRMFFQKELSILVGKGTELFQTPSPVEFPAKPCAEGKTSFQGSTVSSGIEQWPDRCYSAQNYHDLCYLHHKCALYLIYF